MKKSLLILFLLIPWFARAQEIASPGLHPVSLQLEGGSQGVGADVRYGIFNQLSARLGASFIPVTVNNVFTFSELQAQNSLSARFSNIHLMADFVPFKGARGFRLVAGAGYLFKASGSLFLSPSGTYKYGDIVLTPDQVGNLNMDVSWKGVAPYLGIGLFRSFPNHLFNFNLDLGTYYLSSPQTSVIGTGVLVNNSNQAQLINSNISNYRWLPVLQLNFNFKLH